jgi:hypothetical protein
MRKRLMWNLSLGVTTALILLGITTLIVAQTIPIAPPPTAIAAETSENGSRFMGSYGDITALAFLGGALIILLTKVLPDLHSKIVTTTTLYAQTIQNIMDKADKREEVRDLRIQAMIDRDNLITTDVVKAMAVLQQHCSEKSERLFAAMDFQKVAKLDLKAKP